MSSHACFVTCVCFVSIESAIRSLHLLQDLPLCAEVQPNHQIRVDGPLRKVEKVETLYLELGDTREQIESGEPGRMVCNPKTFGPPEFADTGAKQNSITCISSKIIVIKLQQHIQLTAFPGSKTSKTNDARPPIGVIFQSLSISFHSSTHRSQCCRWKPTVQHGALQPSAQKV